MNSHYDPLFAPFDDDAGNFSEYYPDMTKEDFVRMVADRLPDYFSEDIKITDISVKEVVKHNDQHKLGIEFTFADNNFSPVIYPDTLFEDYHAGKPLEEILQALSRTVEKKPPGSFRSYKRNCHPRLFLTMKPPVIISPSVFVIRI